MKTIKTIYTTPYPQLQCTKGLYSEKQYKEWKTKETLSYVDLKENLTNLCEGNTIGRLKKKLEKVDTFFKYKILEGFLGPQ